MCRHSGVNRKGKDNPNYRHGLYCEPSLCSCGNQKDYRARRCAICAGTGYPKDPAIRRATDEEIAQKIPGATSYLALSRELHVSRERIALVVKERAIPTQHLERGRGRPATIESTLTKGTKRNNQVVRNLLLREGLLPYSCLLCGLGPSWNGSQMTLELDHINGDSSDNMLINLRFLCPNCHSQTPTSKGRNCRGTLKRRKEPPS